MNSSLSLALRQVSRKLCIDQKMVELVYRSYWGFIRNTVEAIPMKTMTKEEFDSVDKNFNIPQIGKFYPDWEKVEKYIMKLNYKRNVKAKKNQASGMSSAGD